MSVISDTNLRPRKGNVQVNLIESESGWGQRIDEVLYFPSTKEAEEFVQKFNAKNNMPEVPEWYMYAEIIT